MKGNTGKKPMDKAKVKAIKKKAYRVFTQDDLSIIRDQVAKGHGYKTIYNEYVTSRKSNKKPWSLGGIKKTVAKLKKTGATTRRKGQGRKRTTRTPENIEKVRQFLNDNPTTRTPSCRKLSKRFSIKLTCVKEILRKDLKKKSLRRVPVTRLSSKQKDARIKFATEYIKAVDSGKIDSASIFWSDEKLFTSCTAPSNAQNNRVWVDKNKPKKDLSDDTILAQHKGKWGSARIMVSMAIAKIGATPPFFLAKGVKISGEVYLTHLQNCFFPHMSMIAAAAGKTRSYSLMQDGASSHGVKEVMAAIRKNTGKPFPFQWPSKSPDLNPCDFFLWNSMQDYVENMENPPNNEASLRAAVMVAAQTVDKGALDKAIDNVYERRKKCIDCGGGRFEHTMK